MITEVYINGSLIDIEDDEVVVASYGNITFGEFNKRKGVQSNKWKAPFSPRNKMIFDNSEVMGSNSELPYRKASIDVNISGVNVFSGFAVLEESQNEYMIQSYAKASDFYTTINNKKLTELDLSAFNHQWNETNVRNSLTSTQGYIYAVVFNGKIVATDIGGTYPSSIDTLVPNMFFHTLIKQIAIDAGYTLVGDVLTNTRFLNHIVICNKFPLPIIFGEDFVLAETLPDLTQSKLWLDFANIYGLQFDIDQDLGIIRCAYIDDVIFNEVEDWTDKIDKSEKPTVNYSLEYGQTSNLRFATDDVCTYGYEKEVLIDDETLDLTADIYVSPFFLIQPVGTLGEDGLGDSKTFIQKDNMYFVGAWISTTDYFASVNHTVWHNGTYYKCKVDSTGNEPPNGTYWTPVLEKDIWTIKNRPMYGYLVTDPSSPFNVLFSGGEEQITKVIYNTQLQWPTSYDLNYKVFDRIIQKTKKVQHLVRLNYADINNLDFTKAKKIDNDLYIVEEVRQFKLNRNDSTLVNFIRL